MDAVSDFIGFLKTNGIPPAETSDIIADDTWRYYRIDGDKPNTKKGGYILATDGTFAWGGAIGFANGGEWKTFKSGNLPHMSAEERAEFTRLMERNKKKQEEVRRIAEVKATAEAKEVYDRARVSDGHHPYLVDKKIEPHGVRERDSILVIPMWRDGSFVSVQTINASGVKFFHDGVGTKGAYHALASRDDPKHKFLICEGFATAATLREWFPTTPVVIAFTANNLSPVARSFRSRYPEADLIICADNDAWQRTSTKSEKRSYVGTDSTKNAGIVRGKEAALIVKGRCVYPDWGDHPLRPTDFNDAVSKETGDIDKWREMIQTALDSQPLPEPVVRPKPLEIAEWHNRLLIKDSGTRKDGVEYVYLRENSLNYSLLICNHPRLKGIFSFDEFALQIKVTKPPPWVVDKGQEDEFEVHNVTEYDERQTDYFVQQLGYRLSGAIDKTRGAIADSAKEYSIHPPREYLDNLVWDGTPRLDTWLADYMGARYDDADYVCAVGRAWLIAAVKRLYEPGCKFDNMLVLEGEQGAGKSECFKILSTFGDVGQKRTYFTDSFNMRDCTNKDELMKLAGVVIVEIAEMAGFHKSDQDMVKKFITTTHDKFRAPYMRTPEEWPRQFVLGGTFNPHRGIFSDPTGLRRFWCVKVGKREEVRLDALRNDSAQIWAEATHRYKAGESILLSESMYKKAAEAADDRRVEDYATDRVLSIANGLLGEVTVQNIMRAMGHDLLPGHGNQREARAIADILRIAGYVQDRKRSGKNRGVIWIKPHIVHKSHEPVKAIEEEEVFF